MNKIILFIKSLISYILFGILGMIAIIPALTIAALPEKWRYDNKLYYFILHIFYRAVIFITFLPYTIIGKKNIPPRSMPVIFVANHQSSLDVPFFGLLAGYKPHIWLFWSKFARIPIFGFIARRMNVTVDFSGLRKMISSIDEGLDLVKGHNRDLMIFPEGGRSNNGKMKKFHLGFAVIAHDTGHPVVPVYIRNINKAYPPGSFLIRPYTIEINIGQPFEYQENETEEQFSERVYQWFLNQ